MQCKWYFFHVTETADVNATYSMYIENSNAGIMKKSGMDVNLLGKLLKQPFMKVRPAKNNVSGLCHFACNVLVYTCHGVIGSTSYFFHRQPRKLPYSFLVSNCPDIFDVNGHFLQIFSLFFDTALVWLTVSCVDLQNKIGHPPHNHKQSKPVPMVTACRI